MIFFAHMKLMTSEGKYTERMQTLKPEMNSDQRKGRAISKGSSILRKLEESVLLNLEDLPNNTASEAKSPPECGRPIHIMGCF